MYTNVMIILVIITIGPAIHMNPIVPRAHVRDRVRVVRQSFYGFACLLLTYTIQLVFIR